MASSEWYNYYILFFEEKTMQKDNVLMGHCDWDRTHSLGFQVYHYKGKKFCCRTCMNFAYPETWHMPIRLSPCMKSDNLAPLKEK